MARFLKGIHGAYSGKVGNVIGSRWREVDYVRSLSRPSGKKASLQQLEQRARFALGVSFLSPIKDLLNLGFSDMLQGRSTGYNRALQHFLKHALVGTYPNYEPDFASVAISRGTLAGLMGATWEETSPQQVAVTWDPRSNTFNAFDDDAVILLIYNKQKAFFSILESGQRQDGHLEVNFPASYSGDTLVAWIFAGHRDGVKTSNSYFLAEINLS